LLESNKIQICKSTSLFTPNYQDFWQSQIFMCTQGKKWDCLQVVFARSIFEPPKIAQTPIYVTFSVFCYSFSQTTQNNRCSRNIEKCPEKHPCEWFPWFYGFSRKIFKYSVPARISALAWKSTNLQNITICTMYVFWMFVFAKGALRDLRYFSLTKNPRPVQKNCSSVQISALTRKSTKLKSIKITQPYMQFRVILCIISSCSEFWDFVSDEDALRGLRYFSLTNNLRFVKNISAPQKYLLPQENRKIYKVDTEHAFIHGFVCFIQNIRLFWVLRFCVWWRCSVGSQIFFLDKQSETCQKNFSSAEISAPTRKSEKSTKVTEICFYPRFYVIYTQYNVILSFEILCLMKVLCGVSDIFPWQTIWDLSKIFSSAEIFALTKKSDNPQKWL